MCRLNIEDKIKMNRISSVENLISILFVYDNNHAFEAKVSSIPSPTPFIAIPYWFISGG